MSYRYLAVYMMTTLFCLTLATQVVVSQSVSILFAGDMMQHDAQIQAALQPDENYSYNECFSHVASDISAADIAICNFEVTLGGKPYKGYPQFSAPDQFFDALKNTGFDVFLTANNHCLDRGKQGLLRTIHVMDSLKMLQLGTYADSVDRANRYPLLIEKNGIRIALLNYTYGTNGIPDKYPAIVNRIDKSKIKNDIAKAKRMNPDLIIANMHWGLEYQREPNTEQQQLAKWLVDNGVDHIIGSHPHVVQTMEYIKDSNGVNHLVVYSLGNYISNMSKLYCDGGLTVKLNFVKDSLGTHLKKCEHNIFYVARPVISGLKNYVVIPTETDISALPKAITEKMRIFVADARLRLANCAWSDEYKVISKQ